MKPKEKIIEAEVIDMEEQENGEFHPIMPYKRPDLGAMPSVHEKQKIPAMYQFLDGFILGLEAMERFMRNTRRISRDWFRDRGY